MLFDAIPLAFEIGSEWELRNPLAMTTIGRLLSHPLVLYMTPVVYPAMDRLNPPFSHAAPRWTAFAQLDQPEPS